MTNAPRSSSGAHARTASRLTARRLTERRPLPRGLTASAVLVAVLGAAGVTNMLLNGPDANGGTSTLSTPASGETVGLGGCGLDGGALRVAASPDIAPVVRRIAAAAGYGRDGACDVDVSSMDPADFVAAWSSDAAARPDVWLPDSSLWVLGAAEAGVPLPTGSSAASPGSPASPNATASAPSIVPTSPTGSASVATSPVVMAMSTTALTRLGGDSAAVDLSRLLGSRNDEQPVSIGLLDPRRSAPTAGSLLELRAVTAGTDDVRAALTWALRSSPADLPERPADLLTAVSTDPGLAVPVSEQSLWLHNTAAGAIQAAAVYPSESGLGLDYPYTILAADVETVTAATQFRQVLLSAEGEKALQAGGFRDPDGLGGSLLMKSTGIDPAVRTPSQLPTLDMAEDAIRMLEIANQPSRILTLLDVSASMQAVVPDSGGATRLNLAKAASARGLGLYPEQSEIGLWTFSTHLTPTSDHHEVVPVGPLAPDAQGESGQQRLSQALESVQVKPYGGTGLYDTTLDAVRQMRAEWDPTRVNSVILLSDGQNDDDGISLDELVATLTSEQDPERPVPVISIAFGPDSDVAAMSQISTATGGATYVAADPRDVGEIFLDAVGQRLCRPEC